MFLLPNLIPWRLLRKSPTKMTADLRNREAAMLRTQDQVTDDILQLLPLASLNGHQQIHSLPIFPQPRPQPILLDPHAKVPLLVPPSSLVIQPADF